MKAVPGFFLVCTAQGKLVYISDNITDFLGHSMVSTITNVSLHTYIQNLQIQKFTECNLHLYSIVYGNLLLDLQKIVR